MMNPTVTGALIAGAAALIGFGASVLTNSSTLRANRRLARDQMLWQKKTELYEALESALDYTVWDRELSGEPRAAARALSERISGLTYGVRLYANPQVSERFSELANSLLILYEGRPERLQAVMVPGIHKSRSRLAAAMRSDLQGTGRGTPAMRRLVRRARLLTPRARRVRREYEAGTTNGRT